MGVFGSALYYSSEILSCYKRINHIEDWFLNLIWIAAHNFGVFFMMNAVVVHMDWYYDRYENLILKVKRNEKLKVED